MKLLLLYENYRKDAGYQKAQAVSYYPMADDFRTGLIYFQNRAGS